MAKRSRLKLNLLSHVINNPDPLEYVIKKVQGRSMMEGSLAIEHGGESTSRNAEVGLLTVCFRMYQLKSVTVITGTSR